MRTVSLLSITPVPRSGSNKIVAVRGAIPEGQTGDPSQQYQSSLQHAGRKEASPGRRQGGRRLRGREAGRRGGREAERQRGGEAVKQEARKRNLRSLNAPSKIES